MNRVVYRADGNGPTRSVRKRRFVKLIFVVAMVLLCFGAYKIFTPTPVERAVNQLQFDSTVTEKEAQNIRSAISEQSKTYNGTVTAGVKTSNSPVNYDSILTAYVPVTNVYSSRQKISKSELAQTTLYMPKEIDFKVKSAISTFLNIDEQKIKSINSLGELDNDEVAIIPSTQLTRNIKLLNYAGAYYLDSFKKGAIFRWTEFDGDGAVDLADLKLNKLASKKSVLKVNQTGVTALTRGMMKKLNSVPDATYFSEKIGKYLANADITHVSNEVSFKDGCTYSSAVFCAPPEMLGALKDSGVDLVELTGNHNNDVGNQYNTETIELYRSLGWSTVGGGLNNLDAAKPFNVDKKRSKVTFLGYNYPDSPNGGAISTESSAGANSFDFARIENEIKQAKQNADFVIVDVQFWECYSYPDGYVEFPECYKPIGEQTATFRKLIDLGADMVVGTQAHQPQTYELYEGKPIYYGLGNLYFDQIQWPGTQKGIVLSHYFNNGKLLQTKLAPSFYDESLQTRLMTDSESIDLLDRLNTARIEAL